MKIAEVYADLIIKGRKTIEEVPEKIREEVQKLIPEEDKPTDE